MYVCMYKSSSTATKAYLLQLPPPKVCNYAWPSNVFLEPLKAKMWHQWRSQGRA